MWQAETGWHDCSVIDYIMLLCEWNMTGLFRETRLEEVGRRSEPSTASPNPTAATTTATNASSKKDLFQRKKTNRSYYYIDYRHFVNVVKYKIYLIGKQIETEVRAVSLVTD
jgi:TFIIE alpha subunit